MVGCVRREKNIAQGRKYSIVRCGEANLIIKIEFILIFM
jgi:hypothetical protein